jgi:hypothetical protein
MSTLFERRDCIRSALIVFYVGSRDTERRFEILGEFQMIDDSAAVEVAERRFSWERVEERLRIRDHRSDAIVYPTRLDVFLACVHGDLDIKELSNWCTGSSPKKRSPRNASVSVHAYEAFVVLCDTISPKDLTFKVLREVCREANSKIKQRITVARGFCVAPFLNFLRTLPNLSEVYLHGYKQHDVKIVSEMYEYYGTLVREPFESLLVSARQLTELHLNDVELLSEFGSTIDKSAVKSIVVRDEDMIRCPLWILASCTGHTRFGNSDQTFFLESYEAALRWSVSNGIAVDVDTVYSTRPSSSHPGTAVVDLWNSTLMYQKLSVFSVPSGGTTLMLRSIAFNREAEDQECLQLVNALSLCGHLRSIDLSGNHAGVHTARALAKHVECWPKLQHLRLCSAFGYEDMMSWVFPVPYAWTSLRALAISEGFEFILRSKMLHSVPIILIDNLQPQNSSLGVRRVMANIYETF